MVFATFWHPLGWWGPGSVLGPLLSSSVPCRDSWLEFQRPLIPEASRGKELGKAVSSLCQCRGCGEMGGFVWQWGLAGSEGTLPSWPWRAASPGGELALIRTKLQHNYVSYTGIISISSSHLMLSVLFCLGSICPEFFCFFAGVCHDEKSHPFCRCFVFMLWVSSFIRLFRILKQFMGSSFFFTKLHLWCRGWTHFSPSLLSPASTLSWRHPLKWLQTFPESCCSLLPWCSFVSCVSAVSLVWQSQCAGKISSSGGKECFEKEGD